MNATIYTRSVGFALIVITLLGAGDTCKSQSTQKVEGRVVVPKEDGTVERDVSFEIKVKLSGKVPEGYQAIPCTQIGELMWPKQPLTHLKADEWVADFVEGGTAKAFYLTVLLVPPQGVKAIATWNDQGRLTGSFPGLKLADIPGAKRIDSIKLNLK